MKSTILANFISGKLIVEEQNSTVGEILFEWSHNYYRISFKVSELQTTLQDSTMQSRSKMVKVNNIQLSNIRNIVFCVD